MMTFGNHLETVNVIDSSSHGNVTFIEKQYKCGGLLTSISLKKEKQDTEESS